jgi:hypothetical protein
MVCKSWEKKMGERKEKLTDSCEKETRKKKKENDNFYSFLKIW